MYTAFTDEFDFRQERDFGQKISATFEFIGGHFRPLGRVLLYLVVPVALLRSILVGVSGIVGGNSAAAASAQNGLFDMQHDLLSNYATEPAYWAALALNTMFNTMLIVAVYGYVKCCLERTTAAPALGLPNPRTPDITPAEVWAVVKEQFVGCFFAFWGVTFIVVLGMFMLFIPGLYFSVVLSIFFAIKVLEDSGFGATFKRSISLMRGQWWQTFGLLLAIGIIAGMLLLALTLTATALTTMLSGLLHFELGSSPVLVLVVTSASSLLQLLVYPMFLILFGFQYFSLVEMNDGVGLSRLVNRIGQLPATASVRNELYQADEEGEY